MSAGLSNRVCLVTGATSGIGLEVARALAAGGATVVGVSRNPERCRRAAEELRAATGNPAVEFHSADLALMREVREFAARVRERHGRLDALVNNAGISPTRLDVTDEGLDRTFALNHLGHFLLTRLLLDRLRAAAPARVINVSSGIYPLGRFRDDGLPGRRRLPFLAYADSKLANVAFTVELARRLEGTGVTVNAANPGLCRTNVGLEGGGVFALAKRFADRFFKARPACEGADTLVWLATSDDVAGKSGRLYRDRQEVELSERARDPESCRRLWEASARLTGLEPETGNPVRGGVV